MASEHETVGRLFSDTPRGDHARYWFLGGLGAGILGHGAVNHEGLTWSPIASILLGGLLLMVVLTMGKGKADPEKGGQDAA